MQGGALVSLKSRIKHLESEVRKEVERETQGEIIRARALPGVGKERNTYRSEAMAWRAFYEELRPHITRNRSSDVLIHQADELLREARGR